jgi:hypothetical protein
MKFALLAWERLSWSERLSIEDRLTHTSSGDSFSP